MTPFDRLAQQVQLAAAFERRLATLARRRERLLTAIARTAEAAGHKHDEGRSAAADIDQLVRIGRLIRQLEDAAATIIERLLAAGPADPLQ